MNNTSVLIKRHSKMMTSTLFAALCYQGSACADEFSIGAGALIEKTAYRDYDRKIYPIPIINYENQYVFVKGPNAGVYALNTESDKLYLNIAYLPGEFKTSRTDNQALSQLDNRKLSIMAGIGYSHKADWGNLYTNVMSDINGKSHGTLAEMAYGYSFQFDKLYLEPKAGVEWQSRKYNDYYFGVSQSESARSGLKHYRADSGSTPYLAINAQYAFNTKWQVFMQARYTRLSNSAKDSPMTSSSATGLFATGVLYRF